MAKVSIKQVVSDVAGAYVTVSGDSGVLTYGNIASKVKTLTPPHRA